MKKITVVLCLLMVVMSLSAETGESIASESIAVQPILVGSDKTEVVVDNPFSGAWSFYLNIIVVFGGGLMLLRFATELVAAVIFEGEDSMSNVRKVIVRFVTHIGMVLLSFALIALIF